MNWVEKKIEIRGAILKNTKKNTRDSNMLK